jgi:heat shock protein HslJ
VLQRDGAVTFQRVTVTVRPATVQNPLPGTAWQVTGYYTGQGAVVSPISGTTLTVRFDNSAIGGNAGCNSFNGSYSVSGSNISIGSLGTGMSICDTPTGIMEQEADFLRALQSSTSFQFDADRLTLRRADGTVTAFMSRIQ